jgi:hypothetical protein
VPDWRDEKQKKYGVYLTKKKIFIDFYNTSSLLVFGLAVSSKERAKQILKEFGSRIEKYY